MWALIPLLMLLAAPSCPQKAGAAELEKMTAAKLPKFIAAYQKELKAVDSAYQDLTRLEPPLRDESGKTLTPESLRNRLKPIPYIMETSQQLLANPDDVSAALRLFIETETLTDDLSDLTETCYDNDQEEMADRLSTLATTLHHEKHLIESYALHLAEEMQERLRLLERENQDLRSKLH